MTNHNIKVSVLAIVYNHEKYIRQAIDSILMQKTDFEFEIIINDDLSTDNSAKIIKEYEDKYPEKIKAIYHTENQQSKGAIWHIDLLKYAKGEYIAYCECDDFWTDPLKLQKQADILDNNKEVSGCGHSTLIVDKDGNEIGVDWHKTYLNNDYIYKNIRNIYFENRFSQTCSLMYRKNIFSAMNQEQLCMYRNVNMTGDIKLNILMLAKGEFCFIEKDMACYRYINDHGDNWTTRANKKNITWYLYNGSSEVEEFMRDNYGMDKIYNRLKISQLNEANRLYRQNSSEENKEILMKILNRYDV